MNAYGPLAEFYDQLTEDVDYPDLYRYLMQHFRAGDVKLHRLLDIACGTGSLSFLFAEAGIQTIGMDLSREMLSQAKKKAPLYSGQPQFLLGSMSNFTIDIPVDGVVCMLDSFNHLSDPYDGADALRCFYAALASGGMLIYDIRPRRQLIDFDGQMFIDETDDVCCIWRTEFDEDENLCFYGIDLFVREGELWRRRQEEHYEYAYRLRWLIHQMEITGFQDIRCYGDRTMNHPDASDERVFITARKE